MRILVSANDLCRPEACSTLLPWESQSFSSHDESVFCFHRGLFQADPPQVPPCVRGDDGVYQRKADESIEMNRTRWAQTPATTFEQAGAPAPPRSTETTSELLPQ